MRLFILGWINKVFLAVLPMLCGVIHTMDNQKEIDDRWIITLLAASPSGNEITAVAFNEAYPSMHQVALYNASNLEKKASREMTGARPTCLKYSNHEGMHIAIGYDNSNVGIFECATDKLSVQQDEISAPSAIKYCVHDIVWRNDNGVMATIVEQENKVRISTYNTVGKLQHFMVDMAPAACFDPKTHLLCVVNSSVGSRKFWHERGSRISLSRAPFTIKTGWTNPGAEKAGMMCADEDNFKGDVRGACFSKDGKYLLMPVTNFIKEMDDVVTTHIKLLFFDTSEKPEGEERVTPVARAVKETQGAVRIKILYAPNAERFVCCVGSVVQLFTHQGDPAGSKIIDPAHDITIIKDAQDYVTVLAATTKGTLKSIELSTQVPTIGNVVKGWLNAKKSACVCM